MVSKILSPVFFVGRTFNTISNIYLAGQVGWWAYRHIREMRKEKLQADELKAKFVEEYKLHHGGEEPTEELISTALRAYNAVEYPLVHRLKKVVRLE